LFREFNTFLQQGKPFNEIQKALANVAGICAAVAQDGNALGLTGTERKAEFQRIFQELTGVDPTRPEVEALRRDTIAAAKKIYDNYKTVPDAE
jgi:hypothetical protein